MLNACRLMLSLSPIFQKLLDSVLASLRRFFAAIVKFCYFLVTSWSARLHWFGCLKCWTVTLLPFDTSCQLQRAFKYMFSSLAVVWSNSFCSLPEVLNEASSRDSISPFNVKCIDIVWDLETPKTREYLGFPFFQRRSISLGSVSANKGWWALSYPSTRASD